MKDPSRATPEAVVETLRGLSQDELHNMAEAVRQVQMERALASNDQDAVISEAFEQGFDRSGLAILPWVHGEFVVCPGAIVSKSQTNHRCSFVSVDDVWVWDSDLLVREDKRSSPGKSLGFRAIALVALVDGTGFDVVYSRARAGGHAADRVVSYEIRNGELVEVSQREVKASHSR